MKSMAANRKAITQATFDDAVQENIREFGMCAADAIEDAISQFQAQGVDLSNVVTKLTIQENNVETASESTNHLVESLKTLLGTEPHDESDIITKLGEIKAKCNVDLAHRCLIAKHGTVDILVESCKKYQTKTNLLINVLGTMIALTNGQPDIITEDHISLFCQLIRSQINDATRITSILKLLHNACIKHEGNRQACANNGLIELILTTLQQHKSVPELVKVGCAVLRALTSDDDIRVPYGKAHEHAKIIVNDHAGIKVLLALTRDVSYDTDVIVELLLTLSCLAVRNEFCQEIVDEGGLQYVMAAVLGDLQEQKVVRCSLSLLKSIAGNDKVKGEIVKANCVPLILSAMTRHQDEAQVCEAGCACLAALALRSPSNCQVIIDAGGAINILSTMKVHKESPFVLKSACRAIRNLVSRTRPYSQNFLDNGAEEIINDARKRHHQVEDDAKAALRDLGCNIQLKELWTGKKGSINN